MVGQHKVPVVRHVLGREGIVAFALFRPIFHGGVKQQDHARHAGMPIRGGDPGPHPVGGAVLKALASIGPELVQGAQKGYGQPLPLPEVPFRQGGFGIYLEFAVVRGSTGLPGDHVHIGSALAGVRFFFPQAVQQVFVTVFRRIRHIRGVGFRLSHLFIKIALQRREVGRRQFKIQKLRAAARDDADRGKIPGNGVHATSF